MCILPPAFFVKARKIRTTKSSIFMLIAIFGIAELAHAARFASTPVFPSGGSARYSVAADVNGDGNADILASSDVALPNGGQRGVLTVLLGKGDGTFLPPKWIADFPDGAPRFVAGDFNRDGRPDLAVTSNSSVKVYLGRGDGSFSAPLVFAAGGVGASQIAAAYVKGGSNLDLIVKTDGGVSVLAGNGNGTFQKPITMMVSCEYDDFGACGSFGVGDRNGDGHPDLVFVNHDANYNGVNQIWLGDGTGNFKRGTDVLIPAMAETAVLLADLDGDGKAELIVDQGIGETEMVPPGGIAISWGDGYCCTRLQAGNGAASILARDLNGDGRPDLAVSNSLSNSISVLLNLGNKNFSAAVNYSARGNPGTLTSADLNRDGRPDVALATADGIQPFLNQGGARFPEPLAVETGYLTNSAGAGMADAKAADLNADGHMDLAVQLGGVVMANNIESHGPLYVLLGKGNGQFSGSPAFSDYEGETYMKRGIAIADYNHDGRPDLAVDLDNYTGDAEDGYLMMAMNAGGGHFSEVDSSLPGSPLTGMAAGYFNAGPNGDMAGLNPGSDTVDIFLGNGDGSFRGPTSYHVGTNPNSILVRDVNKDGKQDLVVMNSGSSDISVLLGKGDGTFQSPRSIEVAEHPTSAAIGDFNRDGKLDLVVGGDTVQVLMGHGDGTFDSPVTLPVTGSALFVGQADLRHTNQEDILVANGKSLIVLYGNGDGTFLAPTYYSVGAGPNPFVIGDFNEDGAPDVVGINGSTALILLLNQGGTIVSLKSSATSAKAGQPVTFSATVLASVPGAGEVTGTVAFKDGSKGIGFVPLSKGKVTFTTSKLTTGTHTMSASYWGNGFFNPQISSPVSVRMGP
jgi:hypothetical protein